MEVISFMIRALIFDFDGLILETEGPIYQSWQEVFHELGQELSWDTWGDIIGRSEIAWDPLADLEEVVGKKLDRPYLEEWRHQREMEMILAQPVLPGVLEYLDSARHLDMPLAVASSSPYSWVHGHLTRLGLRDYFCCLRTSDDVQHAKPDPELYLSALECLNIPASEALALEDSPHGITAAKRAGLYCVAVPNDLTRRLDTGHADLRLNSLLDLSLEQLLSRVNHNHH
jgi:HAD superfamily hydrolase (TIGR01509 family)